MKRISILLAFIVTAAVYAAITFTDSGPEYTDDYNTREQKMLYNLAVIKTNTAAVSGSISVTNTVTVTNATYADMTNYLYKISTNSVSGTLGVTNASGSTLSTTNIDMTSLLAILQSVYNTNNATARTNHLRALNLVAISNTVPTAIASGGGVAGWADELGRQVIKGYNQAADTIKVSEVAHPILQTLGGDGTWELLSGVSTNQDGVWFDVSQYKHFSFMFCPTVATNHWVYIDVSLNSGTNWVNISSNYFNSTNNTLLQLANQKYKQIRARYVGTNETTTVRGFAGN